MSKLPYRSARVALTAAGLTVLYSVSAVAIDAPTGSNHAAPDLDLRYQISPASPTAQAQVLRAAAPAAQSAALADIERTVPGLRVR